MRLFTRRGITRTDAAKLASRLKALATPARLQILALPNLAELSVHQVAAAVGIAQPTATHHLHVMVTAGFLTAERRGAYVFHALNPAGIFEVANALRGAR